jgi:hypothetical protein
MESDRTLRIARLRQIYRKVIGFLNQLSTKTKVFIA